MVFRISSLKIAHESNGEKAKNKFLDGISDFVIDWQWPARCFVIRKNIYWE